MPRFFVDHTLSVDNAFNLPEGPARHVQVLRMQPGETITLFNGEGGEYEARITLMGKRDVAVIVIGFAPENRESALRTILIQAVSAAERMDYTIQKATELGVTEIWPVHGAYSQQRLSGERAQKRLAHWQGVAQSACEQSGRTRIPQILPVTSLDEALARAPKDATRLLLAPGAATRLAALPAPQTQVVLLVGPEGGLSDGEESAARASGFEGVVLGPRILRTETAGPAVLSVLQALFGDG
ncbi:16S rRNA (uracil(1498)-N(3))-methyltransferase [Silvimonas amylolytica]|uniref:Ribosomal RNA small subunit methyltransferase E n=1 Tax=Silvimonas amylolytica TaxID=449663 RepID=A0ABQ2PKV3_9NEIS|nr:16S rRNA (uracil(1498)-N(3))-methyltransferase [Silvimonas amylolytica]GGP25836.1 ribosomal RNA small subunit methyltransferase E [Silvimonas amylolytica]